MAFDTTLVTPNPNVQYRNQVFLSWTPAATVPPKSFYQVYIDRVLAVTTQDLSCYIQAPAPGETQSIAIGAVVNEWGTDTWGEWPWGSARGMESVDWSSTIPVEPKRRVELEWYGGTFESPNIAGFYVYGSDVAGGAIDYTTALATITAYPAGIPTNGWGMGVWGGPGSAWGGFESAYSWKSTTLSSGSWSFAVVPFDAAGNKGPAATITELIEVPPAPPGLFGDGSRLHYTLLGWGQTPWGTNPWGYPDAVLTWNQSPG